VYTPELYAALGFSESNVARYIDEVFLIADTFYKHSLEPHNNVNGIHYMDIVHASRHFVWSTSNIIEDQLDQLNSKHISDTCGVVVFDARDYHPAVGVATVGGACINGSNGAVVSCGAGCVSSFFAAQILAHETGHLQGAGHTSCAGDIMMPVIHPTLISFSSCTIPIIISFYEQNTFCLLDHARPVSDQFPVFVIILVSVCTTLLLIVLGFVSVKMFYRLSIL
jgi:hypothetical protein